MPGLAEEELAQPPWQLWGKRLGIGLLFIVVGVGVVLLARQFSFKPSQQQKQMAKIHIVPDTPPPPPPPPKEEKRPEPPKETKEMKIEQPKQEQPVPTEQLKMEGAGSDQGLAGLSSGPVKSEYDGQRIGDAGNRLAWFKGVYQRYVQSALQADARLRKDEYRIVVRLWLLPDGAVSRAELTASTGNVDTDERLRTALLALPPLGERVPEGLPQPVVLRLTSRS